MAKPPLGSGLGGKNGNHGGRKIFLREVKKNCKKKVNGGNRRVTRNLVYRKKARLMTGGMMTGATGRKAQKGAKEGPSGNPPFSSCKNAPGGWTR